MVNTKMNFSTTYYRLVIVSVLLAFLYIIAFLESPIQLENICKEDGLIENLSAFFYLFSSVLSFIMFINSKSKEKIYILKTRRNFFCLILGFFFFFCFGEEISWGQRFFNFSSSHWFIENNLQKEINFHNLNVFKWGKVENSVQVKVGLKQWFSPEGIFILIWLGYCLIIPILNKFSTKARNLFKNIFFPVLPLWIGSLFFLNQFFYILFKSLKLLPFLPMCEIKEVNFAFLYFVACLVLFEKTKHVTQNKTADN